MLEYLCNKPCGVVDKHLALCRIGADTCFFVADDRTVFATDRQTTLCHLFLFARESDNFWIYEYFLAVVILSGARVGSKALSASIKIRLETPICGAAIATPNSSAATSFASSLLWQQALWCQTLLATGFAMSRNTKAPICTTLSFITHTIPFFYKNKARRVWYTVV